jgi:SpoVK/Ycf46/Vps4 family AAA+-type ATPase
VELIEHLNLSTPVVWVKSAEASLVYDNVFSFMHKEKSAKKLYRIHPTLGLQSYNIKTGTWRVVLMENPDNDFVPCGDFMTCIKFVHENTGMIIIPNAHKVAEDILPLLDILNEDFREVWYQNSADELPMQVILVSNDDCPLMELAATVPNTYVAPPSVEHLTSIASHIIESVPESNVVPDGKTVKDLGVAGVGLGESQFRNLITSSYVNYSKIDPEYILEQKLATLKESCGLDIRKPKISFDDIGGLDILKKTIELATWSWSNPQEAEKHGIAPLRRLLMVGIPGTGKSAICEATAKQLGLDLAKIGVSQALSKWIGESEQNTRMQFRILNALAPIVAWIDEFGRDFSGGGSSNDSGTTDRVHGEFLTGLQELPDNIFLMAAANNISGLAPELLRADRFDKIFFVGFPTMEERLTIFKIHLGETAENHDLYQLADATPQWTGAEIKALVKEAKFLTFGTTQLPPTTEQILKVAANFKNRLWLKRNSYVLEMYAKAFDELEWASKGQREEAQVILSNGRTKNQNKIAL